MKSSKFFSAILITVVISTSFAYDWSTNPGDGSPANPYQISTAEQLASIGSDMNLLDKCYILTNDIELSGYIFDKAVIAPKMTSANDPYGIYFSGIFDGSGFIIYNLTIDAGITGNDFLGLFGYLKTAIVKNLGIEQINITGGEQSYYFGGLCGWCNASIITNCYTTGQITGFNYLGGLCGRNDGVISNCYSIVNIEGGNGYQGGLCAYNYRVINNCFSCGTVTEGKNSGGFCGYDYTNPAINFYGQIRNCYFLDTAGPDNGIGIPLNTMQMTQQSSFTGWDFHHNLSDGTSEFWTLSQEEHPVLTLFSEHFTAYPFTGQGTIENPYLIHDVNDLGAIWQQSGKHFKMTNNIDLRGFHYPASVHIVFEGTLDGDGHTISNLQITGGNYLGLFGWLTGEISNLNMIDCLIQGEDYSEYIGSICGRSQLGTIHNCRVHGSVTGSETVGGLAGIVFKGSLRNCFTEGSVNGQRCTGGLLGTNYGIVSQCSSSAIVTGDYAAGGLVGQNLDVIQKSFSEGEVIGDERTGGLVGWNDYGYFSNCFSKSTVMGNEYVGGFAGKDNGSITNCYATGTVTGHRYVGGFVGQGWTLINCYSTGLVNGYAFVGGFSGGISDQASNCYWDIETSGCTDSRGGTGLSTAQMQTRSTFVNAGWDFLNESENGLGEVWHIPAGGGYPELSCLAMDAPVLLHGTGTQDDPYLIGTPEELGMISWYPINGCYTLVEDVNLIDVRYSEAVVPVFNGSFVGNKHTISTMNISGGSYLGLFGYLGTNSYIRNLHLESVTITSPGSSVGGLVGFNQGILDRCSSSGIITGGVYSDFHGGLVGYNDGGKVSSCYTVSDVLAGRFAYNIGGLMGRNHYGQVVDCYAMGTVTGDEGVGGFAGRNWGGNISCCYATSFVESLDSSKYMGGFIGTNYEGIVSNCYATGSVKAAYSSVATGGFAGRNVSGTISNCYSTGKVTSPASSQSYGGFIAQGDTVQTCFWDIETSGYNRTYNLGAIGKTTVQMYDPNTFLNAGWDFVGETANGTEDIWWIDAGHDYPKFWQQSANFPPIADAGEDQTVYAWIDGLAQVQLDGTASFDPDGDPLEYFWYNDANDLIATGAEPNVILPVGEHVLNLIVNDGIVDSEPNDVLITVIGPMEAQMMFVPQVLNPKSCGRYVMAILTLPKGVMIEDLDENQPWRLLPGDIEALFTRTVCTRRWQMVYAVFDRDELIDALDVQEQKCRIRRFWHNPWLTGTPAEITVYGKLKTGQVLFGTDTIRVIRPFKPAPKPHPIPNKSITSSQSGTGVRPR